MVHGPVVCRLSLDDDQLDSTEFPLQKCLQFGRFPQFLTSFVFRHLHDQVYLGRNRNIAMIMPEGLPWWSIVFYMRFKEVTFAAANLCTIHGPSNPMEFCSNGIKLARIC